MSLTLKEVQHIANLARLELSEDELSRYREQLSTILDYFQQLENLDTDKVLPTVSLSPGQASLRADQTHPGLALDELMQNAPESGERLFRVPPVFD